MEPGHADALPSSRGIVAGPPWFRLAPPRGRAPHARAGRARARPRRRGRARSAARV